MPGSGTKIAGGAGGRAGGAKRKGAKGGKGGAHAGSQAGSQAGSKAGTQAGSQAGTLCSASSLSRNPNKTCYSHAELRELCAAYNRTTRGERIEIEGASSDQLLSALKGKLGPLCDTERCWVSLGILPGDAEKRLENNFAPLKPASWNRNPTEWLSNHDIELAITRHTARHGDFRLLGVFPMDFMGNDASGKCVSSLCGFRIEELSRQGTKRAAIVLNTDKHNESGQHWVSLFIHACPGDRRYGVYFFDSTGRPPTAEVDAFSNTVVDQLKGAFGESPEPVYSFNDRTQQKANTECGIFCVHFVMKMLGGCGFRRVCSTIGDDMKMMKLRSELFADR
jgi:hypothetical protein